MQTSMQLLPTVCATAKVSSTGTCTLGMSVSNIESLQELLYTEIDPEIMKTMLDVAPGWH